VNPVCDSGEFCATCSDHAVPAETVEQISVALVDIEVGGTVLVHAGEAIGVVPSGGHDA